MVITIKTKKQIGTDKYNAPMYEILETKYDTFDKSFDRFLNITVKAQPFVANEIEVVKVYDPKTKSVIDDKDVINEYQSIVKKAIPALNQKKKITNEDIIAKLEELTKENEEKAKEIAELKAKSAKKSPGRPAKDKEVKED